MIPFFLTDAILAKRSWMNFQRKTILLLVIWVWASYRFVARCIPQYFGGYPPFSSWYSRSQREAAPTVWDLLTESKVRDESSDLTQRTGTREEDVSRLKVTVDYRKRWCRVKKTEEEENERWEKRFFLSCPSWAVLKCHLFLGERIYKHHLCLHLDSYVYTVYLYVYLYLASGGVRGHTWSVPADL